MRTLFHMKMASTYTYTYTHLQIRDKFEWTHWKKVRIYPISKDVSNAEEDSMKNSLGTIQSILGTEIKHQSYKYLKSNKVAYKTKLIELFTGKMFDECTKHVYGLQHLIAIKMANIFRQCSQHIHIECSNFVFPDGSLLRISTQFLCIIWPP